MADLLPCSILYENSLGNTLRLDSSRAVAVGGTVFDGLWKLTRARRPLGEGGSLLTRIRSDECRTLVMELNASSAQELSRLMCLMRDTFDPDLESRTPGRLWIGDSYLRCWCCGRAKELSFNFPHRARVTLSIQPAFPAWCQDKDYSMAADPSLGSDDMRFLPVENEGCSPAPLTITLHGPADAPVVKINGFSVGITSPLGEGERVVINQQEHTVTKYTADGQAVNFFGRRTKSGHIFDYAPSGRTLISTSCHTMAFDVTLTEQRSEPAWSPS